LIPPHIRNRSQGEDMTTITRRQSLATILSALALATSTAALAGPTAGDSYQGNPTDDKRRRPTSDQINTGSCIPGEPDFDPVQCHKDITTGAPEPG
jgi:hypothetical protein